MQLHGLSQNHGSWPSQPLKKRSKNPGCFWDSDVSGSMGVLLNVPNGFLRFFTFPLKRWEGSQLSPIPLEAMLLGDLPMEFPWDVLTKMTWVRLRHFLSCIETMCTYTYIIYIYTYTYLGWGHPSQDASDHQDYIT